MSSHLRFSLCLAKTLCWSREMLIIIAIACMCGVKSWVMSLLVACFFFGVVDSTSSVFVEYAKRNFLAHRKSSLLITQGAEHNQKHRNETNLLNTCRVEGLREARLASDIVLTLSEP